MVSYVYVHIRKCIQQYHVRFTADSRAGICRLTKQFDDDQFIMGSDEDVSKLAHVYETLVVILLIVCLYGDGQKRNVHREGRTSKFADRCNVLCHFV